MDVLKEAFFKIKKDIFSLQNELFSIRREINFLKQGLNDLQSTLSLDKHHVSNSSIPTQNQTQLAPLSTIPTHIPTLPQEIGGVESQNKTVSTGNRGVPTDNSTDKQTNRQTNILDRISSVSSPSLLTVQSIQIQETLDALDSIKKELRLKIKRLTPQEMLVFTTLYSLNEKNTVDVTYKTLASYLRLSESSIRDYIARISSKGFNILKTRQNNKTIVLLISPEIKKIASLSTLIKLRNT